MFKRVTKILAMVLVVSMMFSSTAFAKEEETQIDLSTPENRISNSVLERPATNANFRYNIYTYYVSITESLSSNANIVIPDTLNDLPVYEIAPEVFKDQSVIKSVYISNNVVKIGDNCFSGCSNLQSVTLSKNLRTLGAGAFENCINLRTITIPDGVGEIYSGTFQGCQRLTNVTFEASGKEFFNSEGETIGRSVYAGAFANCTSLQTILFPSEIQVIEDAALENSQEFLTIYGENRSQAAIYAADHLVDFVPITASDYGTLVQNLIKEKTAKIGDSIEGYGWKVNLSKVVVINKDFTYVSGGTEKTFNLPDDRELIVCCFVVKNTSGETTLCNPLDVLPSVDGYNRKVSMFDGIGLKSMEGYEDFLCANVETNGLKYGYIAFMAPKGWTSASVKFTQDVKLETTVFTFSAGGDNVVYAEVQEEENVTVPEAEETTAVEETPTVGVTEREDTSESDTTPI